MFHRHRSEASPGEPSPNHHESADEREENGGRLARFFD